MRVMGERTKRTNWVLNKKKVNENRDYYDVEEIGSESLRAYRIREYQGRKGSSDHPC